jgi:hypothetical protein
MMNDIFQILYKNSRGELQVRLEDDLAQDVPAWPGQWRPDEIQVTMPYRLLDDLISISGMSRDAIEQMLRNGQYLTLRPAVGMGYGLDRERILMLNKETQTFFTLKITKSWQAVTGVPQIGILYVDPWDAMLVNRDVLAARDALAAQSLPTDQYADWAERQRRAIPKNALSWLVHKRDKINIEGQFIDGRTLHIGFLPRAFAEMPCREFIETAEFWSWLDERMHGSAEFFARTSDEPQADFAIEDLVSLRLHTHREPVQFDFLLWSRP